MSLADFVVVVVCAALGFGIVRNITGPSKRRDD